MKVDITQARISEDRLTGKIKKAKEVLHQLRYENQEMTGWIQYPLRLGQEELDRILTVAAKIQSQCGVFVVLGIGGSSLGAKAVLGALKPKKENAPKVLFAGESLDAGALSEIIALIHQEESCLCVISKSGTTVETLVAFSILKESMREKYGTAVNERIYTVTDATQGFLREETQREGYVSFAIPTDIGGRYSVLTPVGLLPLAVGGVDIKGLVNGAVSIANALDAEDSVLQYASARVCLYEEGKLIEAFESFDPSMEIFGQWLKQLFGESEGKNGKGIYPTQLMFTRDLHSMGQFLQEGNPIIFETMILFEDEGDRLVVPSSAGIPFSGLTMKQLNDCVVKGVIAAHTMAGVPLITLTMPSKNADSMGMLLYFFELAGGISPALLGMNPFNQPGVERYKQEAKEEIQKLWSLQHK